MTASIVNAVIIAQIAAGFGVGCVIGYWTNIAVTKFRNRKG